MKREMMWCCPSCNRVEPITGQSARYCGATRGCTSKRGELIRMTPMGRVDFLPAPAVLEALVALYKPNVQQGNFQPDVAERGANRMLVKAAVALGVASEDALGEELKRLDDEDYERRERSLARINARGGVS